MKTAPMTVAETPFSLQKAAALLDEEEREELITFIGSTPEAGDLIPETGGVRKLRWGVKGRGKCGGVRVIYYFCNQSFPVFVLTVYVKNQRANLTAAERNEMKQLVPLLVKNYGRGRQT
jgi:hypothetical protein